MEEKLKHLEFIQNIITRMNSNSFLIKGWTITLVSALLALASTSNSIELVYISFGTIFIFWVLDAFFLSTEIKFRLLYEDLIKGNEFNFSLKIDAYKNFKNSWLRTLLNPTLWGFYAFLSGIIYITIHYF